MGYKNDSRPDRDEHDVSDIEFAKKLLFDISSDLEDLRFEDGITTSLQKKIQFIDVTARELKKLLYVMALDEFPVKHDREKISEAYEHRYSFPTYKELYKLFSEGDSELVLKLKYDDSVKEVIGLPTVYYYNPDAIDPQFAFTTIDGKIKIISYDMVIEAYKSKGYKRSRWSTFEELYDYFSHNNSDKWAIKIKNKSGIEVSIGVPTTGCKVDMSDPAFIFRTNGGMYSVPYRLVLEAYPIR